MTVPIRIAVVGLGKIASDQHLPAIAGSSGFDLVATVSTEGGPAGDLPHFGNLQALADSNIEVDAVSICTPPQVRRRIAASAIDNGWHVLLEKPPGTTLAGVIALRDAAAGNGVSLLASWHSRCAAGVEPARRWLKDRRIEQVTITWREDVRVWHPGQNWIWQAGGFGVFDPGINALSIATKILPQPFFVASAELYVPGNRAAPIAARVDFRSAGEYSINMDLDFRQEGLQTWDIVVETADGMLTLSMGGARLAIDGVAQSPGGSGHAGEYPELYRRFAAMIHAGKSDVDLSPLCLVADSFMNARWHVVDPFSD